MKFHPGQIEGDELIPVRDFIPTKTCKQHESVGLTQIWTYFGTSFIYKALQSNFEKTLN